MSAVGQSIFFTAWGAALTNATCVDSSSTTEWGYLLAPYLENALRHADRYTPDDIQKHVGFFLHHIAPYLGLAPIANTINDQTSYTPQYPSAMANDLTPFELSLCWKSLKQEYKPIVRFVNDIIPSTGERTRSASLSTAITVIDTLEEVARDNDSSTLKLQVLPELWKQITETLYSHEAIVHPLGTCSQCGSSSTFVGFDLAPSVLSSKFYWLLPSCQNTPEVLSLMDKVFSACGLTNDYFASSTFLTPWHQIRTHIETNHSTLRPRMLSLDATQFPAPRIKIYTRSLFDKTAAFDDWERHLNLGGVVSYPDDFRATSSDLWTSLAENPREWAESRPNAGPKHNLVLYELTTSSPSSSGEKGDLGRKLSCKPYIMCQEIPRPDSFIAKQLLRHCKLAAHASILKAFAEASQPTNFISEIGLAPRTEGTEVSIYLNPAFFSRQAWGVAGDGYMTKHQS
ncbi:hypothetical protein MW887_008643 [Aspergillus wentii]|nr:hypothetical protein MW887_008643 [Aspergillus wentii]